jgi:hypothetical protein
MHLTCLRGETCRKMFYVTLTLRNKILELLTFKRFKHNFHNGLCLYFVCVQVTTLLSDDFHSELTGKCPLHNIKVLLPNYAQENCFHL